MAKLLIAEDDLELCSILEDWLCGEGHVVEITHDGQSAAERLRLCKYDLAILDWELPVCSGISICRSLRDQRDSIPVLILTGRNQLADKEQGFTSGADDYLTKPFNLKELSARIRAMLRRPQLKQVALQSGNLELDTASRQFFLEGQLVQLLPREFCLLEFFMRHPNQTFECQSILQQVWPADSQASPQTVRIHVMRLREKIATAGRANRIQNIRGQGYRFLDAGED